MRYDIQMLRAIALLVPLAVAGCRRPAAPPPEPDAEVVIERLTPEEVKDKVNDTLEKEHEKTLKDVVQ